jgi:hypothetical protein
MLIINPTLARQAIQAGLDLAVFPLTELAKLASVSVDNIRNLIKRGHVKLRFTKTEGYGVRVMYAFQDAIEIMAAAELSNLGLAPKSFGNIAEQIASFTIYQIQEAASIYSTATTPEDFQRYVVIFYNDDTQEAETFVVNSPIPDPLDKRITRIIVDCRLLAIKALFAYANYKQ